MSSLTDFVGDNSPFAGSRDAYKWLEEFLWDPGNVIFEQKKIEGSDRGVLSQGSELVRSQTTEMEDEGSTWFWSYEQAVFRWRKDFDDEKIFSIWTFRYFLNWLWTKFLNVYEVTVWFRYPSKENSDTPKFYRNDSIKIL